MIHIKHIMNIGVVNFHPIWGEKEHNLERIEGYIECAYKRGVQFLVFPEMCLTGYEYDESNNIQANLAEHKESKTIKRLAHLSERYKMYCILGIPEKDEKEEVYDAALICTPEGETHIYRKIHLALQEAKWAKAGDKPCLIETPWGKVGICICYDIYSFPELIRYYAAMGARLVINATAYAKSRGSMKGKVTLESQVIVNEIFIATANLCGRDLKSDFWGGSNIIGPSQKIQDLHYYAGYPFGDERGEEETLYMATIDLTLAKRRIYKENPLTDRPDFRPDLYEKLYNEIKSTV